MSLRMRMAAILVGLAIFGLVVFSLASLGGGGRVGGTGLLPALGRFLRSSETKSNVTIIVAGFASFIIGFGFRDVIGRIRSRAARPRPEEKKAR